MSELLFGDLVSIIGTYLATTVARPRAPLGNHESIEGPTCYRQAGPSHVRTPQELVLPGAMDNLIERLTMTIFARLSTLDPTCCYPHCGQPSAAEVELPLCGRHCRHVYAKVAELLEPENVHAWLRADAKANPSPPAREVHEGYVYFIRMGDRVKIGHTRSPHKRFKQIPLEEVLAVIEGSSSDEKRAHRKWAHLRTTGEWFKADQELLAFARSLPRSDIKQSWERER